MRSSVPEHSCVCFCGSNLERSQYGVWDLKNYDLLYMLPIKDISEIKIRCPSSFH